MKPGTARLMILAAAILVAGLLPWLFGYLQRDLLSPQQVCTQKCAAFQKDGFLVYKGPDTPKDAYKRAESECECR